MGNFPGVRAFSSEKKNLNRWELKLEDIQRSGLSEWNTKKHRVTTSICVQLNSIHTQHLPQKCVLLVN